MQAWKNLLKNLGFGESESKIYLISLEMGPSSVQDLAKKVDVSRMTAYSVIESLTEKGLMSSVQKGKKTLYAAESPERLLSFLKVKIGRMEDTMKEVEKTINELKSVQHGDKPVVKLFEGSEALNNIQSDMVSSKPDDVYEFGNFDDLLRLHSLESELSTTHKQLNALKIPRNAIYTTSNSIPQNIDSSAKRIVLSPKDFDFHGHVIVYKNKVALSSLKGKLSSIIIENEEIAKTVRELFRYIWTKK